MLGIFISGRTWHQCKKYKLSGFIGIIFCWCFNLKKPRFWFDFLDKYLFMMDKHCLSLLMKWGNLYQKLILEIVEILFKYYKYLGLNKKYRVKAVP